MSFIKKIKDFFEKDSTKETISKLQKEAVEASQKAKVVGNKVKKEFDEACLKADVKLKKMLNKEEQSEESDVSSDEQPNQQKTESTNKVEKVKEEAQDLKKEVEEQSSTTDLETLNLPSKTIQALKAGNINSVEELKSKTDEELTSIKDIGKATLKKIKESL